MIDRLFPPGVVETADPVDVLDAAYWVEKIGAQYVRGVMIGSVDGAAAVDGRSGGLGNPTDSTLFAVHRAQADVLLVGSGTARAEGYAGDRPTDRMRELRRSHGLADAPRMAVVSAGLGLGPGAPVFADTEVRSLLVTCAAAPADRLAALREVADVVVAGDETVDMAAALDQLAATGLRRVSCEGGPTLLARVAASGRLDALSLTVAPTLVAGAAPRILDGPGLDPAARLRLHGVLRDADHLFLRYGRGA